MIEVSDGFRSDGGRFALDVRDGGARCTPTNAQPDVRTSLDVLGSLYLGTHKASLFSGANRLHVSEHSLIERLDASFITDTPAVLGYGF